MGFVVLFWTGSKVILTYCEQYVPAPKKIQLSTGVPQGSILGSLLFILHINDIGNCSRDIELLLFADDTNIFLSDEDINFGMRKKVQSYNPFYF